MFINFVKRQVIKLKVYKNKKVLIVCALEEELPPEHNPYRDITFYTGVGKCNATLKVEVF